MPSLLDRVFRTNLSQPLRSSNYGRIGGPETYGVPGYDQREQSYQQFLNGQQYGSQQAVQGQRDLTSMLMDQAKGKDSLSAEQLRQNTSRMQGMQQSMVAGARPSQGAMASRLAMQNASQLGAQMSGQQALAGIAERNAAANALSGHLGQTRGQDISSFLGTQELGLQQAGMQQGGQVAREQIAADRYRTDMQTPSKREGIYGVLGGLSKFAMTSDRRDKENIAPGEQTAERLLNAIKPSTFTRKGGAGELELGFMAQDAEKAGVPGLVSEGPRGKAVDIGKTSAAALVGAKVANDKVNKLLDTLQKGARKGKKALVSGDMFGRGGGLGRLQRATATPTRSLAPEVEGVSMRAYNNMRPKNYGGMNPNMLIQRPGLVITDEKGTPTFIDWEEPGVSQREFDAFTGKQSRVMRK